MNRDNLTRMDSKITGMTFQITGLKRLNADKKYARKTIKDVAREWNEKDSKQRYDMACGIPELAEKITEVEYSMSHYGHDGEGIEGCEFEEDNEFGISLADYFEKYCTGENHSNDKAYRDPYLLSHNGDFNKIIKTMEGLIDGLKEDLVECKRELSSELYSDMSIKEIANMWDNGNPYERSQMIWNVPELAEKIREVEYTAKYNGIFIVNAEVRRFDESNELGFGVSSYFMKYCRKENSEKITA